MELCKVKVGMDVMYVPSHVKGDIWHKDIEQGKVTEVRGSVVFVRFNNDGHSKACYPEQLRLMSTHCRVPGKKVPTTK